MTRGLFRLRQFVLIMEDKDRFINFCIANWVVKKEKQTCVAVMHVPVRLPLEQAPFLNSQSGLRTIFNQPTTVQLRALPEQPIGVYNFS